MKPASFDYHVATSVPDAIAVLEQADGMGKIIAGGQSLMPVLAFRLTRPTVLVDLNRLPGLGQLDVTDRRISIGAMVRHHELLEQSEVPLLSEAASWIGHPAIRSRGTFGGSLSHADPSAEWPVVASALGATMYLEGPDGKRESSVVDFFLGSMDAALEENEILTRIEMDRPDAWGFAEFSRRHGDFGLVSVAVARVDEKWRIAIGGVAGVPHRATAAEDILNAGSTGQNLIEETASVAAEGLEFSSDVHSTSTFHEAMTKEFTRRALDSAFVREDVGIQS